MTDDEMNKIVNRLDDIVKDYPDIPAHNLTAVFLSRVVLLMTMDPQTGKDLLKYVWQQLDEIEQADPGSMIP
jgi:hypothetical protein